MLNRGEFSSNLQLSQALQVTLLTYGDWMNKIKLSG